MRKLVAFFIERSLLVNVMSVGVLIAGLLFMFTANKEAFPRVEYDWVIVTTIYPGATASDIEKHITIPIEDQVRGVDGIKEIASSSIESRSTVAIQLDPDLDNKDKTITDIKNEVDRISDFPREAEDPDVIELSTKLVPIIEISVIPKKGIKSDADEFAMRKTAKYLEDMLQDLPEVAQIDKQGWREREMIVEVNPRFMDQYHVGLNEVILALSQKNLNFPGGLVQTKKEEIMIRTIGEVENTSDIGNVLIRANDLGNWVRIRDVARVKDSFEEASLIHKTDGKQSITLTVLKKESADIIDTVAKVEDVVKKYSVGKDNYHFRSSNDMSYYVKRRLKVLINNGIVGLFLVFITLFITLGWRISIVTVIGVPLAFCGTFVWMGQAGVNINLMSLFGLIIVLGMLVDDAIVVAENIYRHLEEGESVKDSVVNGTGEVILPVLGTILTTIAAFGPLMFMGGIMGEFMWTMPAVVSVALLASWFEAMFILPSHVYDIEKFRKVSVRESNAQKTERFYPRIKARYVAILSRALDHKYKISLLIAVVFFGSLFFAGNNMKFILFPAGKIERFVVKTEARAGTSLEQMSRYLGLLEEIILRLPKEELDNVITTAGIQREQPMDPNEKRGNNYGTIIVNLTPEEERSRKAREIMDWVRKEAKKYEKKFVKMELNYVKGGPPVGKPVSINIKGDDLKVLKEISKKFQAFLKTIPGLKDIKDNFEEGKGELRVIVDEKTASVAGITVYDVATTVRTCFKGTVATTIKKTDEEIDIRVMYPESQRNNLNTLNVIKIANRMGNLVPLRQVARFEYEKGIRVINRNDWKRSIRVESEIDEKAKDVTSVWVNARLQEKFANIEDQYKGVIVDYAGEFKDTQENMQELGRSFVIAVVVIYILLVGIFRSLSHPFIIVSIIPLTFIGVIWAFFFHKMVFSFLAVMGIVGLAGVIVNDSIVLLDFMKRERARGLPIKEATLSAASNRLRPVFLTTITTFFGLVPTAYGIGGYDPFLKPMAVSMSWGLLFGTMITLLATPILYNMLTDLRRLVFGKEKDAESFEEKQPYYEHTMEMRIEDHVEHHVRDFMEREVHHYIDDKLDAMAPKEEPPVEEKPASKRAKKKAATKKKKKKT